MQQYDAELNFLYGIMLKLVQHRQQKYASEEIICTNLNLIYHFYKHTLQYNHHIC